ncbi:MAG: hypothetical protein KC492_04665, partial [Myxococcales bacterium]|nr:hypothetical protein [Myxococcales bacterium]
FFFFFFSDLEATTLVGAQPDDEAVHTWSKSVRLRAPTPLGGQARLLSGDAKCRERSSHRLPRFQVLHDPQLD